MIPIDLLDSIINALGLNYVNNQEFAKMETAPVNWAPGSPRPGENVFINYQGLLKDSGAVEIFMHYGFDSWNTPRTVKMQQSQNGIFEVEIKAEAHHEINFCFKDSADRWDNNHGYDWTLHLQ